MALFTSCDGLPNRTSERSERVSLEIFDNQNNYKNRTDSPTIKLSLFLSRTVSKML